MEKKVDLNFDRLAQSIKNMAKIGKTSVGGVSRVAYSDFDIKGREYVISLMEAAELEVTIDYGGNIIGERRGTNNFLPSIYKFNGSC